MADAAHTRRWSRKGEVFLQALGRGRRGVRAVLRTGPRDGAADRRACSASRALPFQAANVLSALVWAFVLLAPGAGLLTWFQN